MKKIMFNNRYGLTQAVLEGTERPNRGYRGERKECEIK